MPTFAGSVPLAELCCPACRGELRGAGEELQCTGCGRAFPVVLGIPDLRLVADPYIGLEADREKGRRLAALYDTTDFAGLVQAYYRMPDTRDTAEQAVKFSAGLRAAEARSEAMLAAWQRQDGAAPADARVLEIGCGSGALLVHAARAFTDVVGVDIAFRWLVVGRKRLQEAGVSVPLVCANAEALPFKGATRDVVAAESTFEVTRDPALSVREAFRVLKPGGRLWVTTPNKLSLGPDPHLGIPAGGWLPQGVHDALARRSGALPVQRDLQTATSLDALLRGAGFGAVTVSLPDLPERARAALSPALGIAASIYQSVKRMPVIREALMVIGPAFLATARKP